MAAKNHEKVVLTSKLKEVEIKDIISELITKKLDLERLIKSERFDQCLPANQHTIMNYFNALEVSIDSLLGRMKNGTF